MTENQKEEILRSYYYTDVEPTLDRLIEVKDIVTTFEKEETYQRGRGGTICLLYFQRSHQDGKGT